MIEYIYEALPGFTEEGGVTHHERCVEYRL